MSPCIWVFFAGLAVKGLQKKKKTTTNHSWNGGGETPTILQLSNQPLVLENVVSKDGYSLKPSLEGQEVSPVIKAHQHSGGRSHLNDGL